MSQLLHDHRTWIAVAILIGLYLFHCWFWPYKPCKRCNGAGKFRAPLSTAWRACPRCTGRGRRIRTGRKALARIGVGLPPE